MANPEDSDPDSCNAETPAELKKELEKVMKLILDEDDYSVQELDKAIIVSSLRELKTKESVPNESKCPMSGEIMGDPFVVASGQVRLTVQLHS